MLPQCYTSVWKYITVTNCAAYPKNLQFIQKNYHKILNENLKCNFLLNLVSLAVFESQNLQTGVFIISPFTLNFQLSKLERLYLESILGLVQYLLRRTNLQADPFILT